MRELHLFAGAGGGILAGKLLGHTCVGAVEFNPYCQQVLRARQADGSLESFPIHGDIHDFDGKPWRGRVDVVCGGFPCQPWSTAGKRLGADDPRHLWPEMARVVGEVRPRLVFAENVSLAAFAEPFADLVAMGYRVPPAICVSASDVGAPHLRKRWWCLAADANSKREGGESKSPVRADEEIRQNGIGGPSLPFHSDSDAPHANRPRLEGRHGEVLCERAGEQPAGAGGSYAADTTLEQHQGDAHAQRGTSSAQLPADAHRQHLRDADQSGRGSKTFARDAGAQRNDADPDRLRQLQPGGLITDQWGRLGDGGWWSVEPNVGRVAHGVAARVDRLRAIGNGQVPQTAALAFLILMGQLELEAA